jgi:hypothetical protein
MPSSFYDRAEIFFATPGSDLFGSAKIVACETFDTHYLRADEICSPLI